MSMMKCVLVGRGYWGAILEKYIINSDYFDLIGTYSRSEANVTYEQFINQTEAELVFICTPVSTHYEYVKYALQHNKHVFCEKTLTLDNEKMSELYSIAKSKNVTLYVDYIYACSSGIKKLSELTKQIGRIKRVTLQMAQLGRFYKDCDVFGNIGVHMLSVLYILFEQDSNLNDIHIVYALRDKSGNRLEAICNFLYNSIPVEMDISLVSTVKIRRIKVLGECGEVYFDMMSINTIEVLFFELGYKGIVNEIKQAFQFDESNNLKNVLEDLYYSITVDYEYNKRIAQFVEQACLLLK